MSKETFFMNVLPDDAARVNHLLQSNAQNIPAVPPIHEQKSLKRSTKFREDGNAYYRKDEKRKALLWYTQSIAFAPTNSQALPLAYANRAAVLKAMGHFADSIADTQRALKTGYRLYPGNQAYKLFVRQGTCYQNLGQEGQAVKSLNEAMEALECNSTLNEEEKEKLRVNIESQMKYFNEDLGEEECEDLTGDKSIGVLKFDVPSLGSNVNPEIPTASDCIALKYNETYGRHLVATRDIEIGEVLIVEEPFAAFLDPSLCFGHCSHCFKLCRTLLPCQHCVLAMFCSEACIEESRSYHQLECAVMPLFLKAELMKAEPQNLMISFVARVVHQAGFETLGKYFSEQSKPNSSNSTGRTAGFNKDGKYDSSDFHTIANLCYHKLESYNEAMAFGMMAAKLMKLLEFDKLSFSYKLGGFLMKFLSSISYNVHNVNECFKEKGDFMGGIISLGFSVYPTLALMNHECVGNTFYHCYGKTLVARAGKFITKGSQILLFSGKSFLKYPKEIRQKYMLSGLKFKCQCEACENDWPMQDDIAIIPHFHLEDAEQVSMSMQAVASLALLMKESVGSEYGWRVEEHTLPLFKSHLKLLEKFGKSHCLQYYLMKSCVRTYYNMLGNHVGNVEDDGMVKGGAGVPEINIGLAKFHV